MYKRLIVSALVLTALMGSTQPSFANPPDFADERRQPQNARVRAEMNEEQRAVVQDRKDEIKARIEAKRANLTAEKCERNQQKIDELLPKLSNNVVVQQQVLDTMFDRVAIFYETKDLEVANYEELSQNVIAAQLDTQAAVEIVRDSSIEIDCSTPGIGNQLAGFRENVFVARDEIKNYRAALVELIKAMRDSVEEETSNETE